MRDDFMCPISKTLMQDPVMASDGYSYERQAIEAYFKSNNTSPITQQPMVNKSLIPNIALARSIMSINNDVPPAYSNHEGQDSKISSLNDRIRPHVSYQINDLRDLEDQIKQSIVNRFANAIKHRYLKKKLKRTLLASNLYEDKLQK